MENGQWIMRTVEDAGPYEGCGEADRLRCPAVSLAINRLRHLPTAAHAYALLFPPLAAQGNAAVEDAGPYEGCGKSLSIVHCQLSIPYVVYRSQERERRFLRGVFYGKQYVSNP